MVKTYKAFVGTLRADVVCPIRLKVAGSIEIVRRSGTALIWCRFDGVDPVPGEHDNFIVMKARSFKTNKPIVIVKLVATQDVEVSVEGSIY